MRGISPQRTDIGSTMTTALAYGQTFGKPLFDGPFPEAQPHSMRPAFRYHNNECLPLHLLSFMLMKPFSY